jgi:hypothetical protein
LEVVGSRWHHTQRDCLGTIFVSRLFATIAEIFVLHGIDPFCDEVFVEIYRLDQVLLMTTTGRGGKPEEDVRFQNPREIDGMSENWCRWASDSIGNSYFKHLRGPVVIDPGVIRDAVI